MGETQYEGLTKEFDERFDDLSGETRLNLIAYFLRSSGALAGPEPLTTSTDVTIGLLFPNMHASYSSRPLPRHERVLACRARPLIEVFVIASTNFRVAERAIRWT